jgi:DNA-directed RNA polymerase II subunit RPB1
MAGLTGLAGPWQLRMSVLQEVVADKMRVLPGVTRLDTYVNSKPVYGGVLDPRLGNMNRGEPCKTCGCTFNEVGQKGRVNECPGHFGHIEVS